jgi:uroporphyrinogen-III decarboxylase
MLTALANGRPDRLPCQVHGWMDYYLGTYLGGMDSYEAYAHFGMDHAIYVSPVYGYAAADLRNWVTDRMDLDTSAEGGHRWRETISTPKGRLTHAGEWNRITGWTTDFLVKSKEDFALWEEYCPVPVRADLSPVRQARERLRDLGVIRSHPFSPGQGSPWQSFCTLVDTERAILFGMDDPEFLHHALECILQRTLRVLPLWEGTPADMVEIGGGAGSSTVIGPTFFREFCLPYDRRQVPLLHELGLKVVYHLCGGIMQMLDLVAETGADGVETMTPRSMGGDCDLREASRRVGERLFFIGGFDQYAGFERGTPDHARALVRECFEATRDRAGYICCPSDHFFHGSPENLRAFAEEARACVY